MKLIRKFFTKENVMNIIFPYRHNDIWFFDDKSKGLKGEPFVLGIPKMIDIVLELQGIRTDLAIFTFSRNNFPNSHGYLQKGYEDSGGCWYGVGSCKFGNIDETGWLCPATLLYFKDFPERIYFKIDKR